MFIIVSKANKTNKLFVEIRNNAGPIPNLSAIFVIFYPSFFFEKK